KPTEWRRWLATKGPILTRLDCDNTWMNAKNTGGRLDAYDTMSMQGGHAVALVGYDPNQFIVRNSWGTTQWVTKASAMHRMPMQPLRSPRLMG
ncbi:MAG: C1 family peptidase, partial [Methyloceanibacter sp.]